MANLVLVYGMRLLPADDVVEVGDARIGLKGGREARCTMHLLEGGKQEIEQQLKLSVDAFFELHYPSE
jgi:phosphoglycolate phosphatase-like HAD superfamily hydrolase